MSYQNLLKKIWLTLLLVVAGFVFAASAKATSLCLPPTPVDIVNPLSGDINLSWYAPSAVETFTVKVLRKGKTCADGIDAARGEFEVQVPGSDVFYRVPDDNLDCGEWIYCVQATCCDDRCDTCTTDPKKDYCQQMANRYTDTCACGGLAPQFPSPVVGSFLYKCSNGTEAPICPTGTTIVGCYWQCRSTAVTRAETKTCGTDYNFACGGGPNKRLVDQKPSYNLCSYNDGQGWRFEDTYLQNPPGVIENNTPPLSYDWFCGNNAGTCTACRRAVCNSEYQGKVFDKLSQSDDLCKDAKGVITGTASNFTFDKISNKWTWDCIGSNKCAETNRDLSVAYNKNWFYFNPISVGSNVPGSWMSLPSCFATKAGCGRGGDEVVEGYNSEKFFVLNNFEKLANSDKSFLCLGDGKAQYIGHTVMTDSTTGITKELKHWKCVYPNSKAAVFCQANIIDCNLAVKDKTLTFEDWQNNYENRIGRLCQNGADDVFKDSQGYLALDPKNPVPSLALYNKFQWKCGDQYGGEVSCSAKQTECKKPPHESYVSTEADLKTFQMCSTGPFSQMSWDATEPNLWRWHCADDFGAYVECFANRQTCADYVSNKTFNDFATLRASGKVSCSAGSGSAADPYVCKGLCTDARTDVEVIFDSAKGQWNWTCGRTACNAKMLGCVSPPNKGYFSGISDFTRAVQGSTLLSGAKGDCLPLNDGTNDFECWGICTDDQTVKVSYDETKFIWTWTCGVQKCQAFEAGCGEYGRHAKNLSAYKIKDSDFVNAVNSRSNNICLNGGTMAPLNTTGLRGLKNYGKPSPGFTPYGNSELNPDTCTWDGGAGTAFDDVACQDTLSGQYNKEGTWMWRCRYPGGSLYPTDTDGEGRLLADSSGTDTQYFCVAQQKPECLSPSLQFDDSLTLGTLKSYLKNQPQKLGKYNKDGDETQNAFLCDHGYVLDKGIETEERNVSGAEIGLTNPLSLKFEDGFAKLPANATGSLPRNYGGKYVYQCVGNNPNEQGVTCLLDIVGCSIPPDGATYRTESDFKRAAQYDPNALAYYNACERMDRSNGGLGENKVLFNNDTCEWNWTCGGEKCAAAKIKSPFTMGAITGDTKVCSTKDVKYQVSSTCAPDKLIVVWELYKDGESIETLTKNEGEDLSYKPYFSEGSGTYVIKARGTCNDNCASNPGVEIGPVELEVEIQTIETPTVSLSNPGESCEDADNFVQANLTYPNTNLQDCTDLTYSWFLVSGNTETAAPSGGNSARYNTSNLPAGNHTLRVKVKCNSDCAVGTNPAIDDISLTIGQPKTWTSSNVVGDNEFCSGTANKTYSTTIGNCDNPTTTWSLTGPQNNSGNGSSFSVPTDLPAGNYTISFSTTCADPCSAPSSITKSKSFVVSQAYEVPAVSLSPEPNESCEDSNNNVNAVLSYSDPDLRDCTNLTYSWFLVSGNTETAAPSDGDADQTKYNTKNLNPGAHTLRVKVRCNSDCASGTNPTIDDISLTVNPAKTWTSSDVVGDNNFCSGTANKTYSTTIGNCDNPATTWSLTGPRSASGNGSSFSVPTDLPAGNYTISFSTTCADPCSAPSSITKSKAFVVSQAYEVPAVNLSPEPNTSCEDSNNNVNAVLSYSDSNLQDCTDLTYSWFLVAGNTETAAPADGDNDSTKYNTKNLSAGSHTLRVKVRCNSGCASGTNPAIDDLSITINSAKTWTSSNVVGDNEFCSGTANKTYSTTIGNCDNPTTTWSLTGPQNNSGNGSSFSVPTDLPAGNYTINFTTTCADPCSAPSSITKSKAFVVNQSYETPTAILSGDPEICYGSRASFAIDSLEWLSDDSARHCPVNKRKYQWFVDNRAISGATGLTFNSTTLATGTRNITLEITCEDDCAASPSTSTSDPKSIDILNCACGSADKKTFVDNNNDDEIDNLGSFAYCNDGFNPVPVPPSFNNDTWTWTCRRGNLSSPSCSAQKTKCGTASSETRGFTRYYTDSSWTSTNKGSICINGTTNPANPQLTNEVADGDSCNGNIADTWTWTCRDSVGTDTNNCTAKRLACGIGDANNILRNNCNIEPATAGVYRGSYNTTAELSTAGHRCNWEFGVSTVTDTGRGKWYWTCTDSLNSVQKCEARKDCGWMEREDGANFATVQYGSACWTAEDVGTYNDNSVKDMTWGTATRIQVNTGDGACNNTLWSSCKNDHCFGLLRNENSCQAKGVCGTDSGFKVPTDANWHALENRLANGNSCDGTRFNNNDCSPAGNGNVNTGANGYENDGLKDPIAFAGDEGAGYWTSTQKFNNPRDARYFQPATSTLPYFEINSDEVSKSADLNSSNTSHKVRCYRDTGGGTLIIPGGGGNLCFGFGCN